MRKSYKICDYCKKRVKTKKQHFAKNKACEDFYLDKLKEDELLLNTLDKKSDEYKSLKQSILSRKMNSGSNNPMFSSKPWNVDENRKDEIKEKLGKSWKGKKMPTEHKQKLAKAKIGIFGESANAHGPHNVSEEGRLRMRHGAFKGKQSASKHSKGEIELGIYIHEMFADTIWDFSLDFYQCDYCIPSKNIIVEYDGDWYHSGTHYGTAKSVIQKHIFANDKKKSNHITSKGYKLVRVLESDFQKHKLIGDTKEWLSTLLA
jgi:hypothetical protein